MTDTPILDLPLLSAAQAQKHVTVNEALSRLDAVVQLTLKSRFASTPPSFSGEGDTYLVGTNPTDAWEGRTGEIASYLNGGWVFFTPRLGWQAYVVDEALTVHFDGRFWTENVIARSPFGAAMRAEISERDITLDPGTQVDTGFMIPPNASVFGVTGRVLADITGDATSWSLGVEDRPTRYGSGLGLSAGSYILGLSGQPLTYYNATRLRLTADGGSFTGGQVRLAVHMLLFDLPDGL